MLGTYGQVMTRGLLNALVVVAAIELLNMGQEGLGLLSAALGLGGLVGAIFALSSTRSEQLIRTETVSLVFWGLPIAVIGVLPFAEVALAAMIVIGVANATYDVALFTIFQRGSPTTTARRCCPCSRARRARGGHRQPPGAGPADRLRDPGSPDRSGAILPILAAVIYLRIGRSEHVSVVDEELVQLLRRVPAFAEVPMTALERLAAGVLPVGAPSGTALMTQGEPGDRFVVIASGEVEVLVDGQPIHRLGPGTGVGEVALLRRSPERPRSSRSRT